MRNAKWVIVAAVITVILIAGYFLWWKKREDEQIANNIDELTPNGNMENSGPTPGNTGSASPKRGLRNNNPGNIRIPRDKHGEIVDVSWQGKISIADNTDPGKEFEQFTDMVWGCRAQLKILLTYMNTYHLNTILEFTTKWAPEADGNDPVVYAATINDETGIATDMQLSANDSQSLTAIACAMAYVEEGKNECNNAGVNNNLFDQAWDLL